MKLHQYEKTIADMAKKNKDIIVCTAETRWAMRNLPDILGERFLDVGISEQTLIGMAAGLSKMGMFPICHALASFLLMRPYEFIRTDLGYPKLRSLLVGSFNGFISQANGPTHQAIDDISLMSNVPNMKIMAPSNINQTCELLRLSEKKLDGPAYIRFNDIESNYCSLDKLEWDKNQIYNVGKNVAVISYGLCFSILEEVFKSKKLFNNVGLINCVFIKPLQTEFIENVFSSYEKIIIVEDHRYKGSLCYEFKHSAFEFAYKGKIFGINLENRFFKPALLDDVLDYEGFSAIKLQEKIKALL
ncbi:MAG: transketolase C-terminal domain-containing protein [Gammaproteobacteria bacterium]